MDSIIPLYILGDKPASIDKNVVNIIKKAKRVLEKSIQNKFLTMNAYEKIVPFNLWFRYPKYCVERHMENNQNMRIRYYNNLHLTPIVAQHQDNLQHLKKFIDGMSLYQPFYPETFYSVWEFLKTHNIDASRPSNVLNISREERLGALEAIIFFYEMHQQTYQYNVYHSWINGSEKNDYLYLQKYSNNIDNYCTRPPKVDYLGQAYKIKHLQHESEYIEYDFINLDCIHLFNGQMDWNHENNDLMATLSYFLRSLQCLKKGGNMLIRLNLIANESWNFLFDLAHEYFSEHVFYRPTILNPFNSEVYLYLSKYNGKITSPTIRNLFLQNLFRLQMYNIYFLNYVTEEKNNIRKNYCKARNQWINDLVHVIETNTVNNEKNSLQWHADYGLKQIAYLNDYKFHQDTTIKPALHIFKSSAKKIKLKPMSPVLLYNLSYYKRLIEKRAELNYHKRVMDTKPSSIFAANRKNSGIYLTWENLQYRIDPYNPIKRILSEEYDAEMATNAWMKMYEMLCLFPDIMPNKSRVKTFHLCEAPGAFISALNHLSNNRNQTLDWYAQTLRYVDPASQQFGAALEDHYGLIANYPNRWIFGDETDDSGNITHSAVIKAYVNHPSLKDIDFMTADAGLQCDPRELNEQEAYLGKINMGQIICILACLPIGKSAIFKTFLPMAEPLTISMIYLLTHLFEDLQIVKPETSHCTNSEVYIVGIKYRGIESSMLEILYALLDDNKITSKTLLFAMIDKTFFESYVENISNLVDRQIHSLNRNYYYYYHQSEIAEIEPYLEKIMQTWFKNNPVFKLRNKLMCS